MDTDNNIKQITDEILKEIKDNNLKLSQDEIKAKIKKKLDEYYEITDKNLSRKIADKEYNRLMNDLLQDIGEEIKKDDIKNNTKIENDDIDNNIKTKTKLFNKIGRLIYNVFQYSIESFKKSFNCFKLIKKISVFEIFFIIFILILPSFIVGILSLLFIAVLFIFWLINFILEQILKLFSNIGNFLRKLIHNLNNYIKTIKSSGFFGYIFGNLLYIFTLLLLILYILFQIFIFPFKISRFINITISNLTTMITMHGLNILRIPTEIVLGNSGILSLTDGVNNKDGALLDSKYLKNELKKEQKIQKDKLDRILNDKKDKEIKGENKINNKIQVKEKDMNKMLDNILKNVNQFVAKSGSNISNKTENKHNTTNIKNEFPTLNRSIKKVITDPLLDFNREINYNRTYNKKNNKQYEYNKRNIKNDKLERYINPNYNPDTKIIDNDIQNRENNLYNNYNNIENTLINKGFNPNVISTIYNQCRTIGMTVEDSIDKAIEMGSINGNNCDDLELPSLVGQLLNLEEQIKHHKELKEEISNSPNISKKEYNEKQYTNALLEQAKEETKFKERHPEIDLDKLYKQTENLLKKEGEDASKENVYNKMISDFAKYGKKGIAKDLSELKESIKTKERESKIYEKQQVQNDNIKNNKINKK